MSTESALRAALERISKACPAYSHDYGEHASISDFGFNADDFARHNEAVSAALIGDIARAALAPTIAGAGEERARVLAHRLVEGLTDSPPKQWPSWGDLWVDNIAEALHAYAAERVAEERERLLTEVMSTVRQIQNETVFAANVPAAVRQTHVGTCQAVWSAVNQLARPAFDAHLAAAILAGKDGEGE